MQRLSSLTWLVPLIAILAVITAGTGLFASSGNGTFSFTTLHGQVVEMYGRGVYQNDTLMAGAGFRGTDAITLFLATPFLLAAWAFCLRGGQNGRIVLIGVLFYFLYNGASLTFSAAFNPLFLVYTAMFSASLFATILALATIDNQALAHRVLPGFPHRGMTAFLFVAGMGTMFIWLSELINPLLTGSFPELLGPYTTMYTHAFDSAVITPAAVITGVLLIKRKPFGYLLAAPILILCTLIGVVVIGQTVSQYLAGLIFPAGVYIGMVGSWVVMGAIAISLTLAYFRNLSQA